jgi:hypothetical protein
MTTLMITIEKRRFIASAKTQSPASAGFFVEPDTGNVT